MEMIHRIKCTTQTVEQYINAPATGAIPCLRMAVFHVRKMGHKVSLVKAGGFTTPKAAMRALQSLGFDTLEAALDARFERIAPAAALPGDIIALPGDQMFPALTIRLSNNAVLHTLNGGFAISEPKLFVAAWRVPCLVKHG